MAAPVDARDFRLSQEELRQDPKRVFDVLGKLGEGSYGSVYKAVHKKSGVVVALKVVPVGSNLQDIIREINLMNGCDSESIIRFYGSYFHQENLWMFIEYCAAGSLADIMRVCKCTMEQDEIATVCKSALNALVYLHERRKIHRDIKAANILLNADGLAKLADFGVAGQLSDTAAKRKTVIGTPFWMAPEIIQEVGYGTAADIWSLGITCIELAEGRPPYHNIHPMRAIFLIPSRAAPTLEQPEKYSAAFVNFVARCLIKDPKKRPSAVEMLQDPFIANASARSPQLQEKISNAIELLEAQRAADAGNDGTRQMMAIKHEDEHEDEHVTMKPIKSETLTKEAPEAVQDETKSYMSTMITTSYLEDNLGTIVIHAEDDDGADPTTGNDDDLQSIAAISVPDMQTDMSPQPPATATASSTVIRPPVTSFQPALSPIAAVAESPSQSSASREDGNASKNKSYASALGGSAFSAGSNSTAAGSNSTAAGSNPHVDPLPASTASLEDTRELKDILALLDRNMEMELQMIRAKYERKRVPIVEALSARRNDVAHAQPGKADVAHAQPGKAIPSSRTHQPHFS